MKIIKENYFNTAFILVFLMLLWPLYINNFELFIFEILIIACLFVLIGISSSSSIGINNMSTFIISSSSSSSSSSIGINNMSTFIIISSIIISITIISIIIISSSSISINNMSIFIISTIIIGIIITNSIINTSKKKSVLYSVQIISLLSFAIISFTVIPIKGYTVIEYNSNEVMLKKGEYFFNANMNARVTRYNPINSKVIKQGNYEIHLSVQLKNVSKTSLEEMEAFKNYKGSDLLNIDFGYTDPREKIQKLLDEKFPNLEIIIREITYNKPIVWK